MKSLARSYIHIMHKYNNCKLHIKNIVGRAPQCIGKLHFYYYFAKMYGGLNSILQQRTQPVTVPNVPQQGQHHPLLLLIPGQYLRGLGNECMLIMNKKLLLVAVDAFSKQPEVFVVSSTSAAQTAEKLRVMFATHGLPITLVSDNGPPFSSTEFHQFVSRNVITHRRVPPYHPSSNGLAENMVKIVKQALNKANKEDTIEAKLSKFLASCRNTPHSVTGRTPAEIVLGRAPRTRLSLVHPCMAQRMSIASE